MTHTSRMNEQRRDERLPVNLWAQIRIGSQLTVQGRLKDLAPKSAFIIMRWSVYLNLNDEVGFTIQCTPGNDEEVIEGFARISRIADDGLAIYFTKMEDPSHRRLKSFFRD